ncbi:MAG: hypothetical protein FWD74_05720 [Actinomycetia bacterium]|nr:hypothetical protein [Actinomycetes bacterium]
MTQSLGNDEGLDASAAARFSDDSTAHRRASVGHEPNSGGRLRLVDPLDQADEALSVRHENSVEQFLRTVAVATFEEMDARAELSLTLEQVQASLDAHHAARLAAQ